MFVEVFWWLLVGHVVGDFWAQQEAMARGKNRNRGAPTSPFEPPWTVWMTAHALMHGGAVAVATGSVSLGAVEAAAHWCIDFGKCEGLYGFHADQALHILCKLMWAWIAVA